MHNKLNEWIKKNGYKKQYIAEQVGISYPALYQIIKGNSKPTKPVAILIKQFTNGEIDFIGKE